MKASDFIVYYLVEKKIQHVFGYPGGMVTHLMDSFSKYQGEISAHVTYHEQGAAFAACGYAQASGKAGVAYATSGPGATNLITGICNAYFDSIPVLFITGQVNSFEGKGNLGVRQRGFQETDIVAMVASVTKYAAKIERAEDLKWHLDYAFGQMMTGRKGPALLDIPMDVFRSEVCPEQLKRYATESKIASSELIEKEIMVLKTELLKAKRPVLLLGNGIKTAGEVKNIRKLVKNLSIPTVSTMLAIDVIPDLNANYGFVGAYGGRAANFIVAKSDLVIAIGARLDVRQVGAKREGFAPHAKIIRIEVDPGELEYKAHGDEIHICEDMSLLLGKWIEQSAGWNLAYGEWNNLCCLIRDKLAGYDDRLPNQIVKAIGKFLPVDAVITTDVGQNQVWVAQSLEVQESQRIFFSGGHGAMGYSLPAAIGCALASDKIVYSFNGDGGIQMNIQELQCIAREKLPVKIIIFNNYALGMIRHFQEMYFGSNYYQTISQGGYLPPDFERLANAYGMDYVPVTSVGDIQPWIFVGRAPAVIEIKINEPTYVFPKLEFGKPNQDQEPLMDRALYEYLNAL